MKKLIYLVLSVLFLFCGCSSVTPTEPTDAADPTTTVTTAPEPTQESTAAATVPTEPGTTGPLLVKDYLDQYFAGYADYEVIIPEDGVLILDGQESLSEVYIVGDVYITYNADVSFRDVVVTKGNVYCHGILRRTGINNYEIYGYHTTFNGLKTCSAFDGTHGRIINVAPAELRKDYISTDALDYAFETWGNYAPAIEHPEITVSTEPIEPLTLEYVDEFNRTRHVNIFTGKGRISNQKLAGDVYITRDAVIEFEDIRIGGNIYCYGQLKISDDELYGLWNDSFEDNACGTIYAYSFNESCDTFDGVHGLVTGGPILCQKIVIADDALDYAFETFGKQ